MIVRGFPTMGAGEGGPGAGPVDPTRTTVLSWTTEALGAPPEPLWWETLVLSWTPEAPRSLRGP